VNTAKASQVPVFGFHQKRYVYAQALLEGVGITQIKVYTNSLSATPYVVPGGITITNPALQDYEFPLNILAQRAFVEVSMPGQINFSRLILVGAADTWNPIRGRNG